MSSSTLPMHNEYVPWLSPIIASSWQQQSTAQWIVYRVKESSATGNKTRIHEGEKKKMLQIFCCLILCLGYQCKNWKLLKNLFSSGSCWRKPRLHVPHSTNKEQRPGWDWIWAVCGRFHLTSSGGHVARGRTGNQYYQGVSSNGINHLWRLSNRQAEMKCSRLCEEVMRITVVTDATVSGALQVTCRDLN